MFLIIGTCTKLHSKTDFFYLHETHSAHNLNAFICHHPSCFLKENQGNCLKKKCSMSLSRLLLKYIINKKNEASRRNILVSLGCQLMLNTYWGKNFTNGRLDLELRGSAIHVSTYHVSHRLRAWRKNDKVKMIYIELYGRFFHPKQITVLLGGFFCILPALAFLVSNTWQRLCDL